jgi:hypothetical protein
VNDYVRLAFSTAFAITLLWIQFNFFAQRVRYARMAAAGVDPSAQIAADDRAADEWVWAITRAIQVSGATGVLVLSWCAAPAT